ncbi:MAG: hypothetical protein EBU46_21175 [Nitrosomonadaceae bacterium]|nr:hypothetical protein [Nitrosomonadaceae bacterium]
MTSVHHSYEDRQANKHDFVYLEQDGALALKKTVVSSSTMMENDWGWIPVFRSKSKLDEMLPNRTSFEPANRMPNISLVPIYEMENHPTIYQLRTTNAALQFRVQQLEETLAALLTQQPLQYSVDVQRGGRKLQL